MKKKTIIDLCEESASKFGARPFIWEKINDKFVPVSFEETRRKARIGAAGLMSAGVKKGDKTALLSEGRNDWILGELSILYAGAVNVPLSIKIDEPSDLLFRIRHSESKFIIVSERQLPKIRNIRADLPLVEKVFVLDKLPEYPDGEAYYGDIYSEGESYLKEHESEVESRISSITGDDYANISYTSGTTADPKGILLTHRNYTANVEQAMGLIKIDSDYKTLIILPLDHCFAHVAGFYTFMAYGAQVATVQPGKTPMETLRNIPLNIAEFKPDVLLSVPALAKNFRKNIETGIRAKGPKIQKLFEKALDFEYGYNKEGRNKSQSLSGKLKHLFYDKILFGKIRQAFGGNLKFFVGGGALLDVEMQRFYYAIGIPMYQGYGLSEATPIISANSPEYHKLGSSGKPVHNLELKICDNDGNELPVGEKGEIVVRGENVMAGYWKNEKSTAETLRNGRLYTGDMGYMDDEGFLYVSGRFKSLLISGDGEKYSPEGIEEALVGNSKIISQVLLHNNQNPYTVALIVPNTEQLKRRLKENNPEAELESESSKKWCLEKLKQELDEYKKGGKHFGTFPERWLPTTFVVLPEPFTEQNRLLNSTMKVVRGKVEEKYKDLIDFAYSSKGKEYVNDNNINAIKLK